MDPQQMKAALHQFIDQAPPDQLMALYQALIGGQPPGQPPGGPQGPAGPSGPPGGPQGPVFSR